MHNLYELFFGPSQPIWISDLSNLTVFGLVMSVAGIYKRFNCTEKGCWRIGRHPVAGTTYHTCRPHTTSAVHDKLQIHHKIKQPEQHELLNGGSNGRH